MAEGTKSALSHDESGVESVQSKQESPARLLLSSCAGYGLGFSVFLAWVFVILTGKLTGSTGSVPFGSVPFFFIGSALTCCIAWPFAKLMLRPLVVQVLAVAAAVLTLTPILPSFFPNPSSTLCYTLYVLAGVGSALLFFLWGFYMSTLEHKSAIVYPAFSILIEALLLFLILGLLKEGALTIVFALLPLVSTVLFLFWAREDDNEDYNATFVKPPDWKSLLQSSSAMISISFLMGFTFFAVAVGAKLVFWVLLAMFAAAAFKVFDALHNQRFEVNGIIKVLAPTVAVVLLLIPFFGDWWFYLGIALIMCVTTLCRAVSLSAVGEYMHVYKLNPFMNMAFITLGDTLGMAIGYLCGHWIFGGEPLESGGGVELTIALIVIAFIVLQSFVFKDNYAPFTEHKSLLENDYDENKTDIPHAGRWKTRCVAFAEYHRLTPRQSETLLLIAKGYSTSFIMETLCVSEHTVKAHVYGIYRKTDVHNRQELIERIEAFDYIDTDAVSIEPPPPSK